jgi:hypothetical protein
MNELPPISITIGTPKWGTYRASSHPIGGFGGRRAATRNTVEAIGYE